MLLMGKSTISMAIFNSYVKLPEGNWLVVQQPSWKMMELVNRKDYRIIPYIMEKKKCSKPPTS